MHQRELPIIPRIRPLAHDMHDLLFTCSIMGRMWIAADPISAFRRASESDSYDQGDILWMRYGKAFPAFLKWSS